MPAEKGDPRNLTNTTAAHERAPAWSPDGKEIAYVSDESGENELVVRAQDGKGTPKKIKVPGRGFLRRARLLPDGKKIVLPTTLSTLWIVDLASGASKKIATERLYAPARQRMLRGSWSPDSRWVAYTLSGPTYIRTAFVYSVERGQVVRAHGRPLGRLRPRLRPERQVPLLPRLHRRRPAAQLVLAAEHRRPHHERDLRRDAEEGHALAARERERRGEGRGGGERGKIRRERRRFFEGSGRAVRRFEGRRAPGKAGGKDAQGRPKKPGPS